MDWEEFNRQYELRRKANNDDKMTNLEKARKEKIRESGYILSSCVGFINNYKSFVKKNRTIFEEKQANFIIDFDEVLLGNDHMPYSNIWVQSVQPTIYNPTFGPFKEIPLEAVVLVIKLNKGKIIEQEKERPTIQLEICGWFHPKAWGGRNKLNYQPIGKTTLIGFNRIIFEEFEMFDFDLPNILNLKFSDWIYKCLGYYFL